jgi:hypothetical protein
MCKDKMDTLANLESEREQLTTATRPILGDYQDGQMGHDDIIEALRPIQMRIR